MSGKLAEIIATGCAPGIRTGKTTFEPGTVYTKAPKALRALEDEPAYKHGPARGARAISKHFGMPVDFIKKTWSKPVPIALAFLLFFCGLTRAGDITRGITLFDGQTVSAAQLHQLVDDAAINTTFYTSKPIDLTPLSSDYLMIYSPTLLGYYKITAGAFANNVWQQQVQSSPNGIPGPGDLFPYFSAANTNLENVAYSNLTANLSSNVVVSSLVFAATNPVSSNTNVYILPFWPGAYGAFLAGTNMPQLLTWGTNGKPYQVSLLSFETAAAGDLGTNLAVPYVFNEMFAPWTFYGYQTNIYGTNGGGYPLSTNLWGATTNFPIQHLFLTNAFNPTNSAQTLTDQDTVPILSNLQGTNTTTTLQALYEYLTNRNTLPPYTVGRIQFSGIPVTFTVTNTDSTTNLVHTTAATNFMSPTAVSFLFTGAATSQLPSSPQVTSNQIYYALWFPSFTNSFRLYTNYATAVAQTNWVMYTGAVGTPASMYWLTNYTSFNADAIQLVAGGSINTGYYRVYFRTPAANSLYYVTGTVLAPTANFYWFNLDAGALPNTSYFSIETADHLSLQQPSLIEMLVNPQ